MERYLWKAKPPGIRGAHKASCFSGEVLPKSAREVARRIESDPKRAAAIFQKAGIITIAGKLPVNCRSPSKGGEGDTTNEASA